MVTTLGKFSKVFMMNNESFLLKTKPYDFSMNNQALARIYERIQGHTRQKEPTKKGGKRQNGPPIKPH